MFVPCAYITIGRAPLHFASSPVGTIKAPEMQAKFIALGADPVGSSPEEFSEFVKAESAKWARVAKVAGTKLD